MLLLASSVCGLFKWRQFEPEVILLAVGQIELVAENSGDADLIHDIARLCGKILSGQFPK